MNDIHEAKLSQQIKKNSKSRLIWQRTEDTEYITNSHWLVKVTSTAGTKVRAALFEAFGREAQVGQSLSLSFGDQNDKGPNCERIHNLSNAKNVGQLTPVVILGEGKDDPDKRLVVIGKHLVAIDNDYAEMIANLTASGKGPNDPIYFGQELLILPIRLKEGGEWRQRLESYVSVGK